MAFIQPCFIRKNTHEIINRLKVLRIPHNNYDNGDKPWIAFNYGMWISVDEEHNKLFPDEIDCGDNEDLFLALAALRDDTDEKQWFIMDVEEYVNINQGDWFIATDRNGGKHIGTQINPMYCHKATVEELIEHFKKD